jgi:xylulokinase
MALVAGVDSSTQSCKVVIRELETGTIVRSGRASHPDGTEADPEAWWNALQLAVCDAGGLDDVAAVGIGGQQHGMVCIDVAGNVVRPALLWNDTRSATAASDLVSELGAQTWAQAVGSVPVAAFTVSKLRWLARHEPMAMAKTAAVCLPHDWLTWKLVGGGLQALVTDRGDASGTGYWSPATDEYRLDLLELATDRGDLHLPTVLAPDALAGHTVESGVIPAGLAVSVGTGDNMAAALGLGAVVGDVVMSVGTSGVVSVVSATPTADPSGQVAGFADATGEFLPLVCTLNAGQVLDSVRALLGVTFEAFDELARAPMSADDALTLLPFLAGERTPNRPHARGVLSGISLTNLTPESLARASVESIACGLADGLGAVVDCGVDVGRILLVGGGAKLHALGTCVASVVNTPVTVPAPGEYVAEGAAAQAAWALTGGRPEWNEGSRSTITAEAAPDVYARYTALRDQTGPDAWPQ